MKYLYILRHAKAVQGSAQLQDHARGLNAQGEGAARLMGEYFKKKGIRPDYVLCSDAARTRATVAMLEHGLEAKLHVTYSSALYLASPGEIISEINRVDDRHQHLLVVGHNPGVQHCASLLAEDNDSPMLLDVELKFPTCGLAMLTCPDRWASVEPGRCTLTGFVTPKYLLSAL